MGHGFTWWVVSDVILHNIPNLYVRNETCIYWTIGFINWSYRNIWRDLLQIECVVIGRRGVRLARWTPRALPVGCSHDNACSTCSARGPHHHGHLRAARDYISARQCLGVNFRTPGCDRAYRSKCIWLEGQSSLRYRHSTDATEHNGLYLHGIWYAKQYCCTQNATTRRPPTILPKPIPVEF